MHHYGQSLDVLFYEVLDMPLREYEQLKHMKVRRTLDYGDTVFAHTALAVPCVSARHPGLSDHDPICLAECWHGLAPEHSSSTIMPGTRPFNATWGAL